MTEERAVLAGLNLVVTDMARTVEFYRRLGLEIDDSKPWNAHHVTAAMPNGFELEFDSVELADEYDPAGGQDHTDAVRNVMVFTLPSRRAVDDLFRDLVDAGYVAHQAPYDAFWGSRYAVVDDPDGNFVGIMSPPDDAHKSTPPI